MGIQTPCAMLVCVGAVISPALGTTEIPVKQDYMSSGFFQSDFLRGEDSPSSRATNRVTSPVIFGVTGESTYFSFDFNPSAFSEAVPKAVLRVETVATGFFPDVSPSNPAEISVHSLSADPLLEVDQSLPSGPGSWIEFRDQEVTTSSIVSTTTVDGFGVFDWDITSLVNEWILNGDSNFAYTIGTSALLDPEGDAAVAFVNSSFSGLGEEFTARIVIPAPGSVTAFVTFAAWSSRRRR